MKQVIINVPDKKYPVFMKVIKSLDYVKSIETGNEPTKEEILQGIKQAVTEIKLIKAGKLKATPIKDLLDEL